MRSELRDLHRRLGVTILYVTHAQVEAVSMSNQIGAMSGGKNRAKPPEERGGPDDVPGELVDCRVRVGERRRLWNFLGKALGPGCSAVVQLLPPARPATQPLTRYAAESIGQRVYEGWSAAEPNGRRSMRWTMTYRILENGRVVDERTIRQDYLTLGRDDVAAEAGAAGLECDAVAAAGLVRIMRALGAQTRNESVTRHRR